MAPRILSSRMRPLQLTLIISCLLAGTAQASQTPPPLNDGCQSLRSQLSDTKRKCGAGDSAECERHGVLINTVAWCESTPTACSARAHDHLLGEVVCRREGKQNCQRSLVEDLESACDFSNELALREEVGLSMGKPLPTLPVMTPEASRHPVARYPIAAFRSGIEGRTLLEVDVSAVGEIANVRVLESSGTRDLDRSAMEWMRTMRFEPARQGETPVIGRLVVPVDFILGGRTATPGMRLEIPAVPPDANQVTY